MTIPTNQEYVDWINTKILQKIVVVDEANNILCLRRIETGPASRKGKWDLSGGTLSSLDLDLGGEPHRLAIAREIREETGLELGDLIIIAVTSWVFDRSVGKIFGLALAIKPILKA